MAHCPGEEKRTRTNGKRRGKSRKEKRQKERGRVQSDCLKDRLKHPSKTVSKRFSPTVWRKLDDDDPKVRHGTRGVVREGWTWVCSNEREKAPAASVACTRMCVSMYVYARARVYSTEAKRERPRSETGASERSAVSSVTCRRRLPFRHRPSHPTGSHPPPPPTTPFNNNNNRAGL